MMSSTMLELIQEVMGEVEKDLASRKYDPLDDAISLDELEAEEKSDFYIEDGVCLDRDDRDYEEFGYLHGHVRVSTGRKKLVPSYAE